MKKKIYNVTFEELLQAYYDCIKRKKSTQGAIEFECDRYWNLKVLLNDLNNGTYEIGYSSTFIVCYPVYREVFAGDFRDRIVHHLLINKINHIFEEKAFINDAYACRIGRGTLYGVKRLESSIRSCSENYTKETYVFKGDLKSFFMTIDKSLLYEKLSSFITENSSFYNISEKELDFILWLSKKIIFHTPQKKCIIKGNSYLWKKLPLDKSLFSCDNNHGLPIGNLTSQIFANFFLSFFDKYVTETLNFKYYGRYVDDFYIVDCNKEKIKKSINKIDTFLKEYGITLHPKKIYLQNINKGVKFVGGVVKPNRIYVSNRTKGNFYKKICGINKKFINNEKITIENIIKTESYINSYIGHMIYYNTFKLRKKLLDNILSDKAKKYYKISKTYNKVTVRLSC